MSHWKSGFVVLAAAAALAGCARDGGVAHAPREMAPAPTGDEGARVPAGTEFTVSMNGTVGTVLSRAGEPFTAVVGDPIIARNGKVLVPRGALLHGRVARVESGWWPVLALNFESIETVRGPVDLQAMLRSAEKLVFRSPDAVVEMYDPYDAAFYPPDVRSGDPRRTDLGYRDYDLEFYDSKEREIRIPRGAELKLVLTRPLGASEARQK